MIDEPRSTRRAFVMSVGRKAVYVAPAVMALNAARRAAADFTGCVGPGSPCTMHNECCSYETDSMACKQGDGMSCMGTPKCTCA